VLQWATGNVGRNAVEGIVGHPDLDLIGARVYSGDKVGRDVGDLCGIGPLGATHHEMAVATEPIDTPVGVIEAGTVAAQRFRWEGTVGGVTRVSARVNWYMGEEHLDPAWSFGAEGERFEVAHPV
jgi:hypothetical protein